MIPDLHCPCMHPNTIEILKAAKRKFKPTRVVVIGDIVDWRSISYHEKHTSASNPHDEFVSAYQQLQSIYKLFPKADWLIGNHDDLPKRKALTAELPAEVLMYPYKDLFNVNGWKVTERYGSIEIDGVLYRHGDSGKGGQRLAAFANALVLGKPLVQGHHHGQGGVEFHDNGQNIIWGMQVGCLIDRENPAFTYGLRFDRKPILGYGVVIDGVPQFIPVYE